MVYDLTAQPQHCWCISDPFCTSPAPCLLLLPPPFPPALSPPALLRLPLQRLSHRLPSSSCSPNFWSALAALPIVPSLLARLLIGRSCRLLRHHTTTPVPRIHRPPLIVHCPPSTVHRPSSRVSRASRSIKAASCGPRPAPYHAAARQPSSRTANQVLMACLARRMPSP